MRREICICAEIDTCRRALLPRTRVVILMHYRELLRTTNTGRLAQLALEGCEIRVRGRQGAPLPTEGVMDPGRHTFLLFPTPGARELTPEFVASLDKPVTLVVPDGTWGQATKVAKRESFLHTVPRVTLVPAGPTRYGLRRGSREEGLATFEAIARALGALEGRAIQHRLEDLFNLMVSRTLGSRGIRPVLPPQEPRDPTEL